MVANCVNCGSRIGLLDPGTGGLCLNCDGARRAKQEVETKTRKAAAALGIDAATKEDVDHQHDLINSVLLTTESCVELRILRRIDIVTAECAFGMNVFKDLFAGVRDIVGGRSVAIQDTMRDSRRLVLSELRREAHLLGANAVIGVDLNYVDLSGGGKMVMLVASGTAIVVDTDERTS